MNAEAATAIKTQVSFPVSKKGPFQADYPPETTIGAVRTAAMGYFGVADDAQFTYAINFKGRGFDTGIGTFFDKPMPETSCVFCGQCVGVCPTGALKPKREALARVRRRDPNVPASHVQPVDGELQFLVDRAAMGE